MKGLPLFPATLAGSLPKPSWLAEPEKLWAPWKLEGDQLAEGKRDAVRLVLDMQEKAGIDIVSDGEQTRRHFVNGYMEKLEGIDFQNLKTVRIRNRYDANVPRVVGPVVRPAPVHGEDAKFLRASTDKRIKFTLPGPMTIVDTVADQFYGDRSGSIEDPFGHHWHLSTHVKDVPLAELKKKAAQMAKAAQAGQVQPGQLPAV